jgi:hypothetical protein
MVRFIRLLTAFMRCPHEFRPTVGPCVRCIGVRWHLGPHHGWLTQGAAFVWVDSNVTRDADG